MWLKTGHAATPNLNQLPMAMIMGMHIISNQCKGHTIYIKQDEIVFSDIWSNFTIQICYSINFRIVEPRSAAVIRKEIEDLENLMQGANSYFFLHFFLVRNIYYTHK